MIVKVQQSLAHSEGGKSCLVYNKDRSLRYETENPAEVEELTKQLGNRPKGYFKSKLVNNDAVKKGTFKIVLEEEVKEQPW
jgi:hypothetical protein